jgi:hypothetical protein
MHIIGRLQPEWHARGPCRSFEGLPASNAYDNKFNNIAGTNYETAPFITFELDQAYSDVTQVQLYGRADGSSDAYIQMQGYTVSVSATTERSQGTICGKDLGLPPVLEILSINVACPAVTGAKFVTVSKPTFGVVSLAEIRVVRGENTPFCCLHGVCAACALQQNLARLAAPHQQAH